MFKPHNKKSASITTILVIVMLITAVYVPAASQDNSAYAATKKVKVIFDANGGKVSKKTKSFTRGGKYKSLPKPSRSKYTFMGWYTKTHGGAKVYNGRKVKTKKERQTLYARWAPKQYFQYDSRWGNKSHGNGSTIARSGCGPSTMSMAVVTIKNNSVTPATAAKWSVAHGYKTSAPGKTKDGFFTKFPAKYGIKSTKVNSGSLKAMSKSTAAKYHARAKEAVKNGDWVIAFMSPGTWTHHGHFILWYDIEGTRALVRDPNGTKASKTRNKVSVLQAQAWRYWIISVPYKKMISPPTKGKVKDTNALTVRSGASTGSASLGQLAKGSGVTITNRKDDWWKIDYNGSSGYVQQKFITVTK